MDKLLHIQSKELHQTQLCLAGLVAQISMHVVDAVESPGNHGHGDDRGARTRLNDGLCFARLNSITQQIHRFICLAASQLKEAGGPTWNNLDVGSWVHGHHLGINTDAIAAVWVETIGYLNQRQRGVAFWIEIISYRIRP